MSVTLQSGLEVTPSTDPEIIAQPDANKYYIKAEEPKDYSFDRPIQSGYSDAKSQDWRKVFWVLALIAILCLAVALGAGLGAGLAAQHRSSPVVTTTQSDEVITITSVPSTPPTTQSSKVLTTTSIPTTSPTIPSPLCPADDRSTYIATNKPSLTTSPELEIPNTSLAYQIFCYTNFIANPPVMDLQTLKNVTSFRDCLDACALYSFQTKTIDFPAFACTGIAWARVAGATQFCWLKSNVTSSSANATSIYPGIDGAVMVFT